MKLLLSMNDSGSAMKLFKKTLITDLPSVLDRTGKAELRINKTIQLAIT